MYIIAILKLTFTDMDLLLTIFTKTIEQIEYVVDKTEQLL